MNRIRELRKSKGLKLREVAEAINIAPSQLSFYETGKRQPRNQEIWDKLADYFGVSVAYVMGVSDYRNSYEYLESSEVGVAEVVELNAIATIGEKRLNLVYSFFENELRKEYGTSSNIKNIDEYMKICMENVKNMLWSLPDPVLKLLLYWSSLDEKDRIHSFELIKSLSDKNINQILE